MLSERDIARRGGRDSLASADVSERLVALTGDGSGSLAVDGAAVATVRRRADELLRRAKLLAGSSLTADPGPLLALGYPDRIAQLSGGARYRLRHGSGATLPEHDPLTGAGWLVAAEIEGADRATRMEGRIRLAAVLDREDVESIGGEGDRDSRPGCVGRRGRRSAGDDRTCPRRARPRCRANLPAGRAGDHRRARRPRCFGRPGASRVVKCGANPPGTRWVGACRVR